MSRYAFRLVKRPPAHRHIAPRLASGESRVPAGNAFPPVVQAALQAVADLEGKSRSWVIEQIVIEWARHDPRLARMLAGDALAYKPSKAEREKAEREHAADAEAAASRHARRAGGRS